MTTSNGSQSDSPDGVSAGEMLPQPHIVLVDDDDLYSETLGLRLTDLGYTVTCFSGGSSALEHFASGVRRRFVVDRKVASGDHRSVSPQPLSQGLRIARLLLSWLENGSGSLPPPVQESYARRCCGRAFHGPEGYDRPKARQYMGAAGSG
jgi:hypothetical protein